MLILREHLKANANLFAYEEESVLTEEKKNAKFSSWIDKVHYKTSTDGSVRGRNESV
eukprot:gene28375-35219_t